MIISIHRQKVVSKLKVDMPPEMYKYCYRIVNNKELVWGFFKSSRNKKRKKVRDESWKELTSYINANFILPVNCHIWLNTIHLSNGLCRFSFYVEDKYNGII